MLTEQDKFIILVGNESLKKSDAIILLEGDGYNRIEWIVNLYKNNWAPKVVVSGGIDNEEYGSFPDLAPRLSAGGVKIEDIILDDVSQNTRDQAVNIMAIAKEHKWKKIILVASHYHQYRAFLTFLKAMQEVKMQIQIINSPVRNLFWFSDNQWGKRINLLDDEFKRIDLYRQNGHIASFADALKHQKWKETLK